MRRHDCESLPPEGDETSPPYLNPRNGDESLAADSSEKRSSTTGLLEEHGSTSPRSISGESSHSTVTNEVNDSAATSNDSKDQGSSKTLSEQVGNNSSEDDESDAGKLPINNGKRKDDQRKKESSDIGHHESESLASEDDEPSPLFSPLSNRDERLASDSSEKRSSTRGLLEEDGSTSPRSISGESSHSTVVMSEVTDSAATSDDDAFASENEILHRSDKIQNNKCDIFRISELFSGPGKENHASDTSSFVC